MYIVFPTFEIAPLTSGGIGNYLLSVIQSLQHSPYKPLVLLYNVSIDNVAKSKAYFRNLNLSCEIFHVNDFAEVKLNSEDIYDINKISLAIKQSLQEIVTQKDILGIELCEHAGAGFCTFRDKHCNPQSVFKNIPIWVHLHGSREICDLTDRYPVSLDRGNSYTLYNYAERLCLELADAWKSPSQSVADWYTSYYGIHNQVVVSPLPYKKLAEQNSHHQIRSPQSPLRILCPGRIQYIKGSDIVSRACVELYRLFPNQFHITFVGYNVPTANTLFSSSLDEIKSFIPDEVLSSFSFLGKYSSDNFLSIVQNYDLAIFASRVETFCLTAHELNWIGVPLILSDIPAFKDHFQDSVNCYKFDGSIEGLAKILSRILSNPEMLAQITSDPIAEFDSNIFEQLVNIPKVSKVNSNYALFTRIQEIQAQPNDNLSSVSFKYLSVHSSKKLLTAIIWKLLKRSANRLSVSSELRLKIKKVFKTLTNA